jgi:hypothetical protein
MQANPLYFEGLFRVEFSERNLQKAVRVMFPGRPFESGRKEIMGSKKTGTCSNCTRGPMQLVRDLCETCNRSAGSLTGEARAEKMAYIKDKIDRGEVKPRGKNAKLLRLVTVDNGGAFSEKTQEALNKGVEEKARERAESGASAPGSVREVPRSPRDSGAKVEAQLRGLLRLIRETSKMGLATEITVSIKIGGIEA